MVKLYAFVWVTPRGHILDGEDLVLAAESEENAKARAAVAAESYGLELRYIGVQERLARGRYRLVPAVPVAELPPYWREQCA